MSRDPRGDSKRDPKRVDESLDEVLRALRGGAGAKAVAGVFARWEEAVGPLVAAHAVPRSLEGGRLVVEVDEPGWATQLRYLEAELLEQLVPVAGQDAIHSIEVRVVGRKRS